jgi:hypothetical protein
VGSTNRTLNPGCYTSIGITGSGNLTLNPGVYYVTGNVSMTGSGDFTADRVTLYMHSGNVSMTGSGDVTATNSMIYMRTGSLSLTGSGDLEVSAMTSGTYKGLAVYVDRSNSNAVSFTGSGNSAFTGTVYAPASTYTLTGSGGTFVVDSQIICAAATVTGSGNINLNYNADNNYNPIPPSPASITLVR